MLRSVVSAHETFGGFDFTKKSYLAVAEKQILSSSQWPGHIIDTPFDLKKIHRKGSFHI